MRKIILLLPILSIFIFSSFIFSSFDILNDKWKDLIIEQLQKFYQTSPQESVYLHTDKSLYTAGETVWFKAYLQNELDSVELSKILYVELINTENKLLERIQLLVNQLSTHGNIDLPDSIANGLYHLRAYTNYMRNQGEDSFFDKEIQVVNPQNLSDNLQKSNKINKTDVDIRFFPEGGDLVYNLPNKVGFKAVDTNGKGIIVEGEVFDNKGVKSAIFKSNAMGIGSFKLNPVANRTYKAIVKLPNQIQLTIDLPKIQQQGFVMSLENLPNHKLRLRVYSSLPQKKFWVIAQAKGNIYYSISDSITHSVFTEDIPEEIFPQNTVHFTLFDAQGLPHAERVVHTSFPKTLDLVIGKDKQSYKPREKVELSIFAQDATHQPIVFGDFSLAVIDAGKINKNTYEENLLSYFGLTAALKGKIENPAFYLENTTESNKALDDLLLTQGWSRFKWKDLINNNLSPLSYIIEKGVPISGNIKNANNAMLKNTDIGLINSKVGIFGSVVTDENGNFQTNELNFAGSAEILFTITKEQTKEKAIKVTLQERKFPSTQYSPFAEVLFANDTNFIAHSKKQIEVAKAFKLGSDVKVLKAFTVKDSKIEEDPLEISTLKLVNVDAVVKGEDLMKNAASGFNVLNGLVGKVPGVQVIQNNGGMVGGSPFIKIRDRAPTYLYNNVQVSADFFSSIDGSSIDRIEVVKGGGGNVWAGGGSIIAVFSKFGGNNVQTETSAFDKKIVQGYFTAKEFYVPNYEAPTEIEKIRPDLRTTIYWNPQVRTDSLGVAKVSFFTADAPTRYKIIVEGRNNYNILGRKEMDIIVKEQ